MLRPLTCIGLLLFALLTSIQAQQTDSPVWRVLPVGETPKDARLASPRELRDAYHPWTPPTDKANWEETAERLRRQVLVSQGLWPLPEKTPLNPVIHGKIDRGDYTVEKVYFSSLPGFYVTGNLYRPKHGAEKKPGVLCPHGHWANGRFYDAGLKAANQQLEQGAEEYMSGARFPLQARMAQLARMGCVVFHYDMLGYADNWQLEHRQGFADVESVLRSQSIMGLQTWNSIRALDFLESLPDVDPNRIGVTGASGGGTQTFLLGAVDPRPAVAFPAVMVSTAMQGGCVCENAPYLRLGINNVALAALFAPKPLAMSGADDWTIDIETKGLPELKQVYALYGQSDLVHAKCFPQFKHNYNQVSRELMFDWFNEHLNLGLKLPVEQTDFWPLTRDELTVFDEQHPRPSDAKTLDQLKQYLTESSDEQFAKLVPSSSNDLKRYREVILPAAQVMLDQGLPASTDVTVVGDVMERQLEDGITLHKGLITRKGAGEAIPYIRLTPARVAEPFVVWIDERGKSSLFGADGRPIPAVRKLLDSGREVVSADVFQTGEYQPDGQPLAEQPVNETYPGYTFCYNRPLLSNRVRDILTVCRFAAGEETQSMELIGTGQAGSWVLLAGALLSDSANRIVADLNGFSFSKVTRASDPMFLPGALKYGGLGGFAALAAPTRLTLFGTEKVDEKELQPLVTIYTAAGGSLQLKAESLPTDQVAELLMK